MKVFHWAVDSNIDDSNYLVVADTEEESKEILKAMFDKEYASELKNIDKIFENVEGWHPNYIAEQRAYYLSRTQWNKYYDALLLEDSYEIKKGIMLQYYMGD